MESGRILALYRHERNNLFFDQYQTLSTRTPTFTRSENQHSHITPPVPAMRANDTLLGVTYPVVVVGSVVESRTGRIFPALCFERRARRSDGQLWQ